MSKNVYIGVGGVARKVKNIYIGVGGVARKVKKGYIGVGGVARLFYENSKVEFLGSGSVALTYPRHYLAGTSLSNYALFGGGAQFSNYPIGYVEAINSSLSKTTCARFSFNDSGNDSDNYYTVRNLAATSVGNYALFGGGYNSPSYRDVVHVYNASLVKQTNLQLTDVVAYLCATTVGNYAMFAGGYNRSTSPTSLTAFSNSLTKSTINLSVTRGGSARAGTVGSYAIIHGSHIYSESINTSLVRSTITTVPVVQFKGCAGANAGDKLLFAGANNDESSASNPYKSYVNVFDSSLTVSSLNLSVRRTCECGLSLNGYAIFAGGDSSSSTNLKGIEVFDRNLTRTNDWNLSESKFGMASAKAGKYGMIAGGTDGSTEFNTIELFTG